MQIPSPLLRGMSSPQKLAWFLTSKSRWDRVGDGNGNEGEISRPFVLNGGALAEGKDKVELP